MTPTQQRMPLDGPALVQTPLIPLDPALPQSPRSSEATSDLPIMPLGRRTCYCTTCRQFFRSEAGFDMHRVGEYTQTTTVRCLSEAEMLERGMARNAKGQWITEVFTGLRGQRDTDGDEASE